MNARSRFVALVAASLALAGGLVLFDPNGPRAAALSAPPPPVAWPSSVLSAVGNSGTSYVGTNANLTGAAWNTTLTANPKALPTSVASGTKVGGTVAGTAAVGALMVGLDVGTVAAGVVGLPTSGSFLCDLSAVFGASVGCTVQASPDYAANADLGEIPAPGFTGSNRFPYSHDGYSGSITVDQMPPALDLAGGEATGLYTFTAPGVNCTTSSTQGALRVWFVPDTWTGSTTGPAPVSLTRSGLIPIGCPNATSTRQEVMRFAYALAELARVTSYHLEFGGYVAPVGYPAVGQGPTKWYPVGHPQRPAEVDANPQRWWVTTWQCSVGAGGSVQSAPFRETDVEWPAFPQAQCDGSAVTHLVLEQLSGNGTTTRIFEWTAPGELSDLYGTRPDCVGGGCELLLERQSEPGSDRWLSCHNSAGLCTGWASNPAKEETFRCTYGGQVVALTECNVYGPSFEPGAGTGTKPRYQDPEAPPSANPGPVPDQGQTPKDDACPPPFTWTSLINPWWYYKGVVCGIQEAFVPERGTETMGRIRTSINNTTPAVWAGEVSGMFDGLDFAAGSCQGPELHLTMFGLDKRAYLFSACEDPMKNAAAWTRGIATALVVIFGSMACIRALGSGFGWKPSAGGDS